MKRTVDVLISLILLILFMPIMILIALIIRVTMGAPILFKQERPGLDGKPFWLYKFRTMENDRGFEITDYHRITGLGKFLRKYSLDELPQLLNVLNGDMSLVGPRPLLMEYLSLYTKNEKLRHTVKPGITGWAQINGRNSIQWEEKFELDTWYVNNQSFMLDCKVLFLTVLKVLKREGINQQDSVTMKKFTGTKEVL